MSTSEMLVFDFLNVVGVDEVGDEGGGESGDEGSDEGGGDNESEDCGWVKWLILSCFMGFDL